MFNLSVRGRPIVAVVNEEVFGRLDRETVEDDGNPKIGNVVEITEGGDPEDVLLAATFAGMRFLLVGWTRFGLNAVLQIPPWLPSTEVDRADWALRSFTAERSDTKTIGRFAVAKGTCVRRAE